MNIIQLPTDAVEVKDGHPVTSSLRIADIFGRTHSKVLRAINDLLPQMAQDFAQANFGLSEYVDTTGRALPSYELTRDGFTLLVMGFTGPKALAFKIAFIERFNAMEAAQSSGRNFALSVPPVLTLGEYIETRDHLNDLKAELDVLFAQFKEVDVRCKPAEIEAMDKPYERISNRLVRTRDLLTMTDANGVPRKAVEELLGITNTNARQHVYHGRHEGKEAA